MRGHTVEGEVAGLLAQASVGVDASRPGDRCGEEHCLGAGVFPRQLAGGEAENGQRWAAAPEAAERAVAEKIVERQPRRRRLGEQAAHRVGALSPQVTSSRRRRSRTPAWLRRARA